MNDYSHICTYIYANVPSNYITVWKKSFNDNIIRASVGTFIKINEKIYILACYHGVKHAETIFVHIIFKNKNMKAKKKFFMKTYEACVSVFSHELDLVLLETKSMTKINNNIKYINMSQFNSNLPKINNTVSFSKNKIIFVSKDVVKLQCKTYECIIKGTEFLYLHSYNMPAIPYIKANIDYLFNERDNIKGISGSIVSQNQESEIIGMVSDIITKTMILNIIPSFVILRFLNEFVKTGSFKGLCSIMAKLTICDIDMNNTNINAICIEDNYNINYNRDEYNSKNIIGARLKKNDIIIKVNEKNINKNGMIYCSKLGYILLTTYIAMHYQCNDLIKLMIVRKNDRGLFDKKNIKIRSRPIRTTKYIPIVHNNNYLELNGLIFVELNEELIEMNINNGIILKGLYINFYHNNPYRNNNKEKVLVLIDIMRNKLNDNILEMCDNYCLPLINTNENEYILPVIKQINKKKKVLNLMEMYKILHQNVENTIYLHVGDKQPLLKIKIVNKNIQNIGQ